MAESSKASQNRPLLWQLLRERHWQSYDNFLHQFNKSARELGASDDDPRLVQLTVSKRQFERWVSGKPVRPRPNQCRVLEHMFGFPVDELFSYKSLLRSQYLSETGGPNKSFDDDTGLSLNFRVISHQLGMMFCKSASEQRLVSESKVTLDNLPGELELVIDAAGVITLHEKHELTFETLTDLCIWQRLQYEAKFALSSVEIARIFDEVFGMDACNSHRHELDYIFSCYEVVEVPTVHASNAKNVVAAIATPSTIFPVSPDIGELEVFLSDRASFLKKERKVLSGGVADDRFSSFGVSESSLGIASWDALAFMQLDAHAMNMDQVIKYEIRLQSLWELCHALISRQIENDAFLRRYVQEEASQLLTPSATESSEICFLREAIVATSRIRDMVDQVMSLESEVI